MGDRTELPPTWDELEELTGVDEKYMIEYGAWIAVAESTT